VITRPQAVDLLARHGATPSRVLGQNFVVDANTVRRIARLAGVGPGHHVVEVGAGLGSLTLALVATGAEVTAVEVDRRLLAALREVMTGTDVRIVEGDAMTLDWAALLARASRWDLVANLPYNVATPLVLDLLGSAPTITTMVVMVQREVGERLAAAPGGPGCGIPSVRVAYWATAELLGRVPASVFLPRPRIESVLVRIVRRDRPAVEADPDRLFALVRAGFGQRRKMLRGALGGLVGPGVFAAAAVRPEARAQELTIQDWGRLAEAAAASGPER